MTPTAGQSQFPADAQNTAEVLDVIATRIYATVEPMRKLHDVVDACTADILRDLIDRLEKLALRIESANRKV